MTPGIIAARKNKINHHVHAYTRASSSESYGSPVAEKLDVIEKRVFKTLVVNLDNKTLAVTVVPVSSMLSMKLIAIAAGVKKPKWPTSLMLSVQPARSWVVSAR